MSTRRSARETTTPARYGFPSSTDLPLQTTEDTLKEDREVEEMSDFTLAQQATIGQIVAAALANSQSSKSPTTEARTTPRALTADLQPSVDYYLPVLDPLIAAVESHRVKYPRSVFTDHLGDIGYDAWKMEMKLFFEEFSGNFRQGQAQVRAYFKCTGGEAKTIILQHMDPDFGGVFDGAEDVLKALDQRFFDYNHVQAAKSKYQQLIMGNMTYDEFRKKFTNYASTAKISRSRWFEDVCEKISPALKRDVRIEKYKMNGNYAILDEFLAIADRESRNIAFEESQLARKAVVIPAEDRGRNRYAGILKKDNWRPSSLVGPSTSGTGLSNVRLRSPSPLVSAIVSPALSTPAGDCRLCHKSGHWMRDCPDVLRHRQMEKRIAALQLDEDERSEDLSKNC